MHSVGVVLEQYSDTFVMGSEYGWSSDTLLRKLVLRSPRG